MDDCCAVCAETLEWVAYGPCGHREVCTTCVVRLRFICNDRHCCICKTQSGVIFVTKALGDYTRTIADFSAFPSDPSEGQVSGFWFHEGTQAFFDELDHYKMVKAMCRLSCTVCDKLGEHRNHMSKGRAAMKNVDQLRSHLFNKHKLFMCSLCLEGRKVFICEQKLYTKAQLSQHIKTGDSEVDGSESERGGFMGHPICEFCQDPFYGDNELYLHMSTEHYTCHICQRQHPGQYEYYRNYDDMEMHFRQDHFLCEDETCLAKKFVVFASESEMKRHNIKEHGQHISRSKHSAVLQIPTSFRFQQINWRDRRVRRLGSQDYQPSSAVESSSSTANAEAVLHNPSNARTLSGPVVTSANSVNNPFEALSILDSEPSLSRHTFSVGQLLRQASLEDSLFPPLTVASSNSQRGSGNVAKRPTGQTMATRLRQNRGTVKVLNASRAQSAASYQPNISSRNTKHWNSPSDFGSLSSSSLSNSKPPMVNGDAALAFSSSTQEGAATNGLLRTNSPSFSSFRSNSITKVGHSAPASNLVGEMSIATQIRNVPASSCGHLAKAEDVQSANKGLVGKIRAALESDEDKFATFKIISADYRKDLITTEEYLANVRQFGLSHLVPELARLCPNPQKQKELVEIYNFNLRSSKNFGNSLVSHDSQLKSKGSKKGKEKCEDGTTSHILKNHKLVGNGKSKALIDGSSSVRSLSTSGNGSHLSNDSSDAKKDMGSVGGGNKPRKKMPKFLRNRLGDMSAAKDSDTGNNVCPIGDKRNENNEPSEGLLVHGVWRNGGGRKLAAMVRTGPRN